MQGFVRSIPEGVSIDDVVETLVNGRLQFTYIIKNNTRFLLKDITIATQWWSSVNGNSGEFYAGYEVQPYTVFQRTFSPAGCIKVVKLLYWVGDETRGRQFDSADAPSGTCATSRGMILSENLALAEMAEQSELDGINLMELNPRK